MLGGHCPQPFLLLSSSLGVLKSSCCGQGREARRTPPDFTGVLVSWDCSQKKATAPASLLTSMKKENWEVKMGTTQPIYEHQRMNIKEVPLKTREALANPPHFPVPPILLQLHSTLSRTERHFLVGKQNERYYSWCFQISKLSRDARMTAELARNRCRTREWVAAGKNCLLWIPFTAEASALHCQLESEHHTSS